MAFYSLPAELQLNTLLFLPFRDALNCRAVCKQLQALIDTNKELILEKDLGAAGLKDNPICADSRDEKRECLWQCNVAWANLHWHCRRQIQLSGTGRLFDISDGLCFHTVRPSNNDGAAIEWFRLPSRREPNPSYSPERVLFDVALEDFAVDPSRDLIIGVQLEHFKTNRFYKIKCNLYAKTISTNEVHPAASSGVLSYSFITPVMCLRPHVEICGNHVGVLLSRGRGIKVKDSFDKFLLLDWTTGVARSTMGTYGMQEHWETFCFLTRDSVLIPSTCNSLLNIFHFGDGSESLKHDVSLLLPEPLTRDGLRRVDIRAQRFSSSSTYSSHPTGDTPPFVSDPDEAVIILSLDYRYHTPGVANAFNRNDNLRQVVAIPRRTLVRYARLARDKNPQFMSLLDKWHGRDNFSGSLPTKTPKIPDPRCAHERFYMSNSDRNHHFNKRFPHVHVEQWIHQTRWGIDSATPSMGMFAHGSRFLSMTSRVELPEEGASCVAIYDFNLRNERRGLSNLLHEENIRPNPTPGEPFNENEEWNFDEETGQRMWPVASPQIIKTPRTVLIPEVFEKPFTTNLPYRVVETDTVLPWDSAMIDGERIIGVQFGDLDTGSISFLDVIVI